LGLLSFLGFSMGEGDGGNGGNGGSGGNGGQGIGGSGTGGQASVSGLYSQSTLTLRDSQVMENSAIGGNGTGGNGIGGKAGQGGQAGNGGDGTSIVIVPSITSVAVGIGYGIAATVALVALAE